MPLPGVVDTFFLNHGVTVHGQAAVVYTLSSFVVGWRAWLAGQVTGRISSLIAIHNVPN